MGSQKGILRNAQVLLHEIHDPGGLAMLQTVTVGTIPHQLAVVNLTELVNLPVDDGIVLGTAKAIAQGGTNHLATGQQA